MQRVAPPSVPSSPLWSDTDRTNKLIDRSIACLTVCVGLSSIGICLVYALPVELVVVFVFLAVLEIIPAVALLLAKRESTKVRLRAYCIILVITTALS